MPERRRQPLLGELYRRYLLDQDTAPYASSVADRYNVGALERLLVSGERLTRRAAALAIGMIAGYESNAALGRALHDDDRGVRILAENGIRALWCRVGSDAERRTLAQLIRLNTRNRSQDAVRAATELLEGSPYIAEVWNQRAIALFTLHRFADSAGDCAQALEINPYHYGAAAGLGHCHLRMGNRDAALESFQRALRLNPNLEGVRAQVHALRRSKNGSEGNPDH